MKFILITLFIIVIVGMILFLYCACILSKRTDHIIYQAKSSTQQKLETEEKKK